MGVKFFADHCVPSSVVNILQREGFEILILKDYLPTDAADPLVLEKAGELGAVLLSLNGDFADIVSYPPKNHHEVIT